MIAGLDEQTLAEYAEKLGYAWPESTKNQEVILAMMLERGVFWRERFAVECERHKCAMKNDPDVGVLLQRYRNVVKKLNGVRRAAREYKTRKDFDLWAREFEMEKAVDDLAYRKSCSFDGVWDVIGSWSQKTFGTDQERGPVGPLRHMKKEIEEELLPPNGDPASREEYADCLILLCDAARRAGMKPQELLDEAAAKMIVNKRRTYLKPSSPDAISEHVKSNTDVQRASREIRPEVFF